MGKEIADASSPKKRKKENTTSISKSQPLPVISASTDIYKKESLWPVVSAPATAVAVSGGTGTCEAAIEVILNEEEEAVERDAHKDLELFCKTSENLRTIAKEINELKNSNSPQTSPQIIDKRIQASLLFVVLKKLNRLEKFRTNQNRDKLHKAKQQADSCHLQLQNLLYEILHLEKEITKCLQFKSKDEEIDLVSVDHFYEEAPKSVSRPEVTKMDSHQLKLARLEWELKQRKQLAALCHDLQSDKEKVAAGINKKQSQLDNLAPMLKDLFNASKPVQDALGLPSGPSPSQQRVAEQLPPPLYFLFVQADALREAGDKYITVKIEGDEEEVQRMKQSLSEAITPDDSDSDAQDENGRESGKRHHGHRKKSKQDRLQERKRQLLMAHPLSVILNVTLKDGQGSISMEFSYLVKLHIVTVKPKVKLSPQVNISSVSSVSKLIESEYILTELFPEDFGEGSPNTANYYQLKQVGIDSFDSSQLGLAYVWAQRVCGLNFASGQGGDEDEFQTGKPPVPSRQVSQLSLPNSITAIKRRLKARIALCAQIQALESGKLQETEVRQFFSPRLVAELTHWTPLSWPQYQALGFTAGMVQHHYVTERDILYKGTLVRGSARLTLAVAIKNCYPLLPPVFALQAAYENKTIQASNNDSIRDIEREINAYFKELVDKTKSVHNLLTAQVLRLITNFDILLEASTNQDFPRDKIFIKSNRGRNRAWPFKQLELSDGVFHFTQR